jgi:hypothetical protein
MVGVICTAGTNIEVPAPPGVKYTSKVTDKKSLHAALDRTEVRVSRTWDVVVAKVGHRVGRSSGSQGR